MGSAALVIVVVVALVAVAGWLVVRARQPAPPPNANESGPDAMWDSDGAVPREPGGLPMQRPAEGMPDTSERIADQARRESSEGPGH
jgi:hypothetical protein